MKTICVLLVCLLTVASTIADLTGDIVFHCDTLEPAEGDHDFNRRPENGQLFQITIDQAPVLCPNQEVTVTLSPLPGQDVSFRYFIGQAREEGPGVTGTRAVGVFTAGSNSRTWPCVEEGDTWCQMQNSNRDLTSVSATWRAPSTLGTNGNGIIMFTAAVMLSNGSWWTDVRSIQLPFVASSDSCRNPQVDTAAGEDEDVDDATKEDRAAAKWRQHQQELIDEEDDNSEGKWQELEEKEKRENEKRVQDEMMEFERMKQQEEEARMARIQMEIRDKEEHDRVEYEYEEEEEPEDNSDEIDPNEEEKPSGSAMVLVSVSALLSALFALLL